MKKPIVVEAEQFFINEKPWPKGVFDAVGGSLICSMARYRFGNPTCWTSLKDGDWIVTYEEGNQEVYSEKAFRELFEPYEVTV